MAKIKDISFSEYYFGKNVKQNCKFLKSVIFPEKDFLHICIFIIWKIHLKFAEFAKISAAFCRPAGNISRMGYARNLKLSM